MQMVASTFGAYRFGPLERYVLHDRPVSEDLFILIPGIMGSELYVDGKPAWSPKVSAIFDGLTSLGNNLQRLKISKDSDTEESLDDGVTVGKLIPDIHIIPGFVKIDGYSGLRKKLVAKHRLQPGKNYFEFAYDWRRDNRAAARRLQNMGAKWLKAWRETGPSKEKAQLVLVGHSMGGLVARYFLEALGGWVDARALITFGTPYRGSVKALDYVSNGYLKNFASLSPVTELVRSFTSTYQLMPIYDCCSPSPGEKPGALKDLPSIPNVDMERVIAALAFHDELRDRAAANKENAPDSTRGHYEFCPIMGVGQPTPSLSSISPTGLDTLQLEDEGAGDGTVSRVSAEAPLPEPLSSGRTVHEFHGSLQNNDAAWWELTGALERLYLTPRRKYWQTPEDIEKEQFNAVPLNPDVKIRLLDAHSVQHDFQCEVRRADEGLKSTLEVSVQSVVSDKTVTQQVTLDAADRWQTVNFGKLDPGMYRCSASASKQVPGLLEKFGTVTDIFLVV
jgi:pimeloyl-ACP methyl ester carboxylesterase